MQDLWSRVDDLIDRATGLPELREHRLELLALRRWRSLGRPIPAELIEAERAAAVRAMAVPVVLARLRAALAGPVILFKGPEVATRYRDAALRPYGDLDVLVPDAHSAHERLRAAGFEPVGDPALFRDIHHLRPLVYRPYPLPVEVHAAPKWVEFGKPPPTSELIAAAEPSRLGVAGISTLRPDHHTLVLAAHSWAHEPFGRLLELVDVAAMADGLDAKELRQLAESWQIGRLWCTTSTATQALFARNGPPPLPLRLWARNLPTARRRTVLESHLARSLAPFSALPLGRAAHAAAAATLRIFVPAAGERWRDKLVRAGLALRHAFVARAQHERRVDERPRE
jgi:hypothetical protein